VSTDDLEEQIVAFEDYVSAVAIANDDSEVSFLHIHYNTAIINLFWFPT